MIMDEEIANTLIKKEKKSLKGINMLKNTKDGMKTYSTSVVIYVSNII